MLVGNRRSTGESKLKENDDLPDLQLVMMASSVKSNHASGSASTTFFRTGGNIAVLARGSTGCGPVNDRPEPVSSVYPDRLVPAVSARASAVPPVNRDAIEPLAALPPPPPRGRCSMPTLKSHRHRRRSSPTLPKR